MKCENLSAAGVGFLAINNLNIIASCSDVDVSKESLFTIHASPHFWHSDLEKGVKWMIQPDLHLSIPNGML